MKTNYLQLGGSIKDKSNISTIELKPKYINVANTPMIGMNLLGQPYNPEPLQQHLDSLNYAQNFKNIINNPSLFNPIKASNRIQGLMTEDINARPENVRRKDYAEALQFQSAGEDALNQLKNRIITPTVSNNFKYLKNYKDGGKLSKDYIKKARLKPGGSNVGKKTFADGSKRVGPYAGPSGGAPKESYPIGDIKHGRAALKLAHNAPNSSGIKNAVYKKYPSLKK